MSRIILCSSPYLGMCNRFFQTAYFIAFCKTHRLDLNATFLAEYSGYFPEIEKDFFIRCSGNQTIIKNKPLKALMYWLLSKFVPKIAKHSSRIPWVLFIDIGWEKELNLEQKEILDKFKTKKFIFLMGWHFKSHINLYNFQDSIRTVFKPIQSLLDKIDLNFMKYRALADVVVGMHIRRGDYKTFESGRYYYSNQQYLNLIKQISNLFNKKVVFVICSNESLLDLQVDDLTCFITNANPVEDLYTLAQCDYIAGPPSTFSMWAAFYGLKPLYSAIDPNYQFNLSDFKLPQLNS